MRLLYAIDLRVQDLWRMDDVARWASHLDATVDLIFVDPFGNYAPSVLDAELAQHLREGLERSRQADRELLETALAALPRASRGAILMEHGDPRP